MDGRTLMELYKMCLINSPSMFQALRTETTELHSTPLSINTYLVFLLQMKQLIGEKDRDTKSRFHTCTLL
jgi:hypothetical protein